MNEDRETLARWIDNERERIISFLQAFIRCKSPNPPGDTTGAARCQRRSKNASAAGVKVHHDRRAGLLSHDR